MIIKVCGMREIENIQQLAALRIDMIGFIFYKKSSRYVKTGGDKKELKEAIYDITGITEIPKVGVFVNETIEKVLEKARDYNLSYIQLHGTENVFYCQRLKEKGLKIIKAFSVGDTFNFTQTKAYEFLCDYFLFDTKGKKPGGNGVVFNWGLLEKYEGETPFLLSGGIGPESTAALQKFKHPKWLGLDLNSRFEIAPAQKNIGALKQFLAELREARVLKSQLPNWD